MLQKEVGKLNQKRRREMGEGGNSEESKAEVEEENAE